ncbi:hypothetical protein AGMMS4957_20910 [Bacteroidia bacterium]|nr:hypothetical protein AGMMS4957_20910 [Bacteroidia bacterium]
MLHACSDYDAENSFYYNKPSIYSESDKVLFSEVIFFVKPYVVDAGQRKYVVTDTLKNVSLKINNKIERTSDSYALDIDHLLAKETLGDYQVTAQSIHYPVVMGVTMIPEELTTAGQYADLLNNYMNLQPGIYVCQIVSFDIKTALGTLKTVYTPAISFSLEVKENMLSADLGVFEVELQ